MLGLDPVEFFSFWSLIKKHSKSLNWVHWLNLIANQSEEGYRPDVGWFGLEVIPALVHVIQPVLQEGGFFGAAQGFDHLRLVAVHALVDVIVGIDLRLDVLENRRQRRNLRFFSRWGYWAWTSSAEMLVHTRSHQTGHSSGPLRATSPKERCWQCETNCTKHFWRPEQLRFVFFGHFFDWLAIMIILHLKRTFTSLSRVLECTGELRSHCKVGKIHSFDTSNI